MKRFIVIGLGNFGFYLAKTLYEDGHEVLAIDRDRERVGRIQDLVSEAMILDAIHKDSLKGLGIAAAEADQNGCSAIADRNAAPSNQAGSWRNAIAAKHAAPARSETIMTRLRSNRSPSTPPSGAKIPATPNVRNSVNESHVAESVRS